jgi:hypothetical protein
VLINSSNELYLVEQIRLALHHHNHGHELLLLTIAPQRLEANTAVFAFVNVASSPHLDMAVESGSQYSTK